MNTFPSTSFSHPGVQAALGMSIIKGSLGAEHFANPITKLNTALYYSLRTPWPNIHLMSCKS